MDKWTKTKKSTHTNFELFSIRCAWLRAAGALRAPARFLIRSAPRLTCVPCCALLRCAPCCAVLCCREKDIPIDMLELPNKSEKIQQFAWEPRGSRFALLHGDGNRPTGAPSWVCVWGEEGRGQPHARAAAAAHVPLAAHTPASSTSHLPPPVCVISRGTAVSIYNMKDTKPAPGAATARGVVLLHTMTNKQCTSLHWSPSGRFLLLAGLGVRGGWAGEMGAVRCTLGAALACTACAERAPEAAP